MSEPSIIVWDADDVLNRLMFSWLDYWSEINNTDVSYSELSQNPPHSILGISREEYLDSLDNFRNSESGKNVLVNDTILRWFENHGNKFRHMVCTARPINTMPNQAWWIYYNYGQWIYTVHAAKTVRDLMDNHHAETKADFISWMNKEVLFIDDSEENVNAVSETGSETMLYPQPWNSSKHSEEEFIAKLNEKLGL